MASLLASLPPPPSRFRPLAPYCPLSWHPTATHRLASYCYSPAGILLLIVVGGHPLCPVAPLALLPLRSFGLSSVTPSHGIALPPWLLYNAIDRCNDLHDRASGLSGPTVSVFSPIDDRLSTPLRPAFLVFEQAVSFVLGRLRKGLGLSTCTFLCIASLRVWGILSWLLGRGDFSYALCVLDLSHEEVKRAVVCIYRFFSPYSSPCIRLFVSRNKQPIRKKKKETKNKNHPRDRIFTQPSKYFSILNILQYDYAFTL